MKILDVLGSRRMAVAVLTAITGFYYLFVAFTNCTDTDTNRHAVAGVLSMHSTIHNSGTDWRAITNSGLALTAYVLIVIWESLIAAVMLTAAVVWIRALVGRPSRFRVRLRWTKRDQSATVSASAWASEHRAAKLSSLGWTMAVLLFAGGFLTIGGEWFRMWASKEWNASSAALQNFLIAAVGLILVHMPGRTWLER